MNISPFPWHRPKADPRAARVEPLVGVGLGHRRIPAPDRPSLAFVLAMLGCLLLPIGFLLAILSGLPPPALVALAVAASGAVAWGVLQARAAKRRAAERAEARHRPGPSGEIPTSGASG